MNYLKQLNAFNTLSYELALSSTAQLLYYKLLATFNRAGWPSSIRLSNAYLMGMCCITSEKSIIAAKQRLVSQRLISMLKGSKSAPTEYSLPIIYDEPCGDDSAAVNTSVNAAVDMTVNVPVNTAVNTAVNAPAIYKLKEKQKGERARPCVREQAASPELIWLEQYNRICDGGEGEL